MSGSLIQFEADLTAFAKKIDADIRVVQKRVILDLHNRIIALTPVDTGRLRASWGIAKGTPSDSVIAVADRMSASEALSVAKKQQEKLAAIANSPLSVWWIYNNLPYAISIEFGHSKQAPAGMVRIALAEVESEMNAFMQG